MKYLYKNIIKNTQNYKYLKIYSMLRNVFEHFLLYDTCDGLVFLFAFLSFTTCTLDSPIFAVSLIDL